MKISNCKVNHITEPMGFYIDNPVFSWNVTDCEHLDSPLYTKLSITSEGTDCGGIDWTSLDGFLTQVDIKLKPRTEYQWQVSVRNEAGEQAESTQCFETGKLTEIWEAK